MSGFLRGFYADNKQLEARMPDFCPVFCPLPCPFIWVCISLKHAFSPLGETWRFPEMGEAVMD
jgi:hypothetical protein